jgi:XTP/dITP diphosphohydrolase
LVLATHNDHKVRELRAILEAAGALGPLEVVGAGDLGVPAPKEDGLTFAENALIKARNAAEATGLPAVADDSGLCVPAMGGAPGVFSARWAGGHGDDAANLALLLDQLRDVPDAGRAAWFECAAALVAPASGDQLVGLDLGAPAEAPAWPDGGAARVVAAGLTGRPAVKLRRGEVVVTGRMPGRLTRAPRGAGGFGYDPILIPDGFEATAAELTPEQKNAISHRGKAFRSLAPAIRQLWS